jgi:hypothetical protein
MSSAEPAMQPGRVSAGGTGGAKRAGAQKRHGEGQRRGGPLRCSPRESTVGGLAATISVRRR